MLLWLAKFSNWFSVLNVFHYTTFRAVMAALTALAFSLMLGPWTIRKLTALKAGQAIRSDGPQTHLVKAGTPTMGGVLILLSITFATLLWGNPSNPYLGTGALGFYDDWRKVVYKDPNGVSAKFKMVWQTAVALAAGVLLFYVARSGATNILIVPFFKQIALPLGVVGFVVLAYFTIVGTSNAVNLTDGLDGLAAFPVVLVAGGLAVFAYVTGHVKFAGYLQLPFVPAVIVRQEFVLVIMGGLFVVEALSVMLQVGWYKKTKKRIFLMAPIHHHFEQKGWKETQVVVRFWIITIVLVLIGLSTLKIR